MKVNVTVAAAASRRDDQVTIRPPFDPAEFARQSELSTSPPPAVQAVAAPDDPVISTETTEVLFVDEETVPALAVAREDLEWFDLAPLVRNVLRFVDGERSIGKISAEVGQSSDQGIALVEQLVRDGLVVCK
jgi:hypothetical protein